jgi:hypothetical protein
MAVGSFRGVREEVFKCDRMAVQMGAGSVLPSKRCNVVCDPGAAATSRGTFSQGKRSTASSAAANAERPILKNRVTVIWEGY